MRTRILLCMTLVLLPLLAGCGGGSRPSALNPGDTGGRAEGTARFHVDVQTGQVSIAPLGGGSSRAVFAGNTIGFNSSLLLDQPGNTGRKVLHVSLTNRSGEPIGQMPDGAVTGLKVLFSDFINVGAFSDPRPNVTVSTFAGTGANASVNGPNGSAAFSNPMGVAVAEDGTVYVADNNSHLIRQIKNGYVSTLAGGGPAGANGLGPQAGFTGPYGLAVNPQDGALLVAENTGHRLRRVDSAGRVSTIAGTGVAGDTEGSGVEAQFRSPMGVAVDNNGTIYVVEQAGHRIRRIQFTGWDGQDPASYTVSTLAGAGTAGFADGVGAAARFNAPRGVAVDDAGTVYVADVLNNRIRRISPAGEVITIGGSGAYGTADGSGETASFQGPTGIVSIAGSLVIADKDSHILRQMRLKAGGIAPTKANSWFVQRLAGTGSPGSTDGPGNSASFNGLRLLATSASGNLYIPEASNKIRLLRPNSGLFPVGVATGSISTEPVRLWNADGVVPNGNRAMIEYPTPLMPGQTSYEQTWDFLIPDGVTAFEFTATVEANTSIGAPPEAGTGAGSARVLVRTLAGGNVTGFQDGVPAQVRFNGIGGVALDEAGNAYIADTMNHAVRCYTTRGGVFTLAGVVGMGQGSTDAAGNLASFNRPTGIAVNPEGTVVYVTDYGHTIRRIAFADEPYGRREDPAQWTVSTIAGSFTPGATNGLGSAARFNNPVGLAMDAAGNLYVTEATGNRVRKVQYRGGDPALNTNWYVSLVAGDTSGSVGTAGTTDGTGAAARFNAPSQIAVDKAGVLYVADKGNHRIRKITPDGVVTTLAGPNAASLDTGYTDAARTSARFNTPAGIAVDAAGYLYVGDTGNHVLRRVSPTGVVATVAGVGASSGSTDGAGNLAKFTSPTALAVDASGNLYAADGAEAGPTRLRLIQRVLNAGTP